MTEEFYYIGKFTNCTKEERNFMKAKSCLLTISVGQEVHEREKLRTTLETVNSYFKKCIITVNDTLQRHSLSIYHPHMTEQELYDYSLELGDQWIERNSKIFREALRIPFEILRWNEWFGNARYHLDRQRVQELYDSNTEYKSVVHDIADGFVSRFNNRSYPIDYQVAFNISKDYLLEECAAMLQWFDYEAGYELYFSIRNEAISETFRLLEPQKNEVSLRPIGMKLNKYVGARPILDLDKLAIENIIKISPGHIYWKNKYGVFEGCNLLQAKSFGFKKIKSLIGKTDFDILDYDMAFEIRKNDIGVMESKVTQIVEERTIVNGKKSVYISHKSPIKDSSGAVVGVLGVSIDITAQKELESQLKQKSEELKQALSVKTEFLNNISHEIRTPIGAFSIAADALANNWDEMRDEQRCSIAKLVAQSAGRIKNLTMHLIDATKFQDNISSLNMQKTNLTKLIRDFVDEAEMLYTKAKNIEIEFSCKEGFYTKADDEAIVQVVRNIVINAIKFSPEDTAIKIILEKDKEDLKVTISDEGVGVPEDELEKVFTPFYQSSITKTGAGGVGLGLNISKQIIVAHQGKIWAVNNKEKGTSFIFTLKVLESDGKPQKLKQEGTILVIDDEESMIKGIELGLGVKTKIKVVPALDGYAGLGLLEEKRDRFDAVLLDVMMPGISGIEVLKIIKKKWPELKVIMHSGIATNVERDRALKLGASAFISKPYEINKLLELL